MNWRAWFAVTKDARTRNDNDSAVFIKDLLSDHESMITRFRESFTHNDFLNPDYIL